MKRIFIIATSALLALAACSRENVCEAPVRSLDAIIDGSAAATKTIMLDNPGLRLESFWKEGDGIGIFGNGAANVRMTVNAADISRDGKTARFTAGSDIPGGKLTALSPYQASAAQEGGAMTFDFPTTQKYTRVNGVAQPDPECNFMLAEGSANAGLTFRNAMSIIKIGQVFDQDVTIRSVEFRDLSGAAVCGKAKVSWNGGAPTAEITGSGSVITLDCGDGIALSAGGKGIFFMIVPARKYAAGFEVTFVADGGEKTVRTVGKTGGKTLDRSIVHLVGEVSAREPLPGTSSVLKPTAQIMTPEMLEKVNVVDRMTYYVKDENGRTLERPDGSMVRMPHFQMVVPKEMNHEVGGWLIFDTPSDELPYGGVYRITRSEKQNDNYYDISAEPETDIAAAFEDVTAGSPLQDAAGNILEDGGLPIDISSFVSSIVDQNGKEVPFSLSPEGKLQFSEEAMSDLLGLETKAGGYPRHTTFKSPKLSLNSKGKNNEVSVGGAISLDAKIAVRLMQGTFQYFYVNVTPSIEISLEAVLKAEETIEAGGRLFTINVLPIPIAPGILLVPQLVITAKCGVGGSIQVSGSFKVKQSLGTYSMSYNTGDGLTLRWLSPGIDEPLEMSTEFGGVEGSLYAQGGIGVNTNLTLYGMCGLGISNDLTMKFGTAVNSDGSLKLFLTPEIEVTPMICFAFGSHKFNDFTGKVSFDPIWERYIRPKSKSSVSVMYEMSDQKTVEVEGSATLLTRVPMGISGIKYEIELEGECAEDIQVALDVYTGSEIKVTPDIHNDPLGSDYKKYCDDGVAHLYPLCNMCDTELLNPRFSVRLPLGTYKSNTKEQKFTGTAHSGFQQGVPYGVVPVIVIGEHVWTISRGSTARWYNPFIYWWPYRSDGMPYEKESDL